MVKIYELQDFFIKLRIIASQTAQKCLKAKKLRKDKKNVMSEV